MTTSRGRRGRRGKKEERGDKRTGEFSDLESSSSGGGLSLPQLNERKKETLSYSPAGNPSLL